MASNRKSRAQLQLEARQGLINKVLRTIALEIDPRTGSLKAVADDFGVHHVTLSVWVRKGFIPREQATKLRKRYGEHLVDVDLVSEGE